MSFSRWWGCALSEISFWRDPHWLGLKPHGRSKRRTVPPCRVTNIFLSPRNQKYEFRTIVWCKIPFSEVFREGSPCLRNFSQQQIGHDRLMWGSHLKIGIIWPTKHSTPKAYLGAQFQGGPTWNWASNYDFGVECLVGQMMSIFRCDPHISLSCPICCWEKFLRHGDPPRPLWKKLWKRYFTPGNGSKLIFLIPGR